MSKPNNNKNKEEGNNIPEFRQPIVSPSLADLVSTEAATDFGQSVPTTETFSGPSTVIRFSEAQLQSAQQTFESLVPEGELPPMKVVNVTTEFYTPVMTPSENVEEEEIAETATPKGYRQEQIDIKRCRDFVSSLESLSKVFHRREIACVVQEWTRWAILHPLLIEDEISLMIKFMGDMRVKEIMWPELVCVRNDHNDRFTQLLPYAPAYLSVYDLQSDLAVMRAPGGDKLTPEEFRRIKCVREERAQFWRDNEGDSMTPPPQDFQDFSTCEHQSTWSEKFARMRNTGWRKFKKYISGTPSKDYQEKLRDKLPGNDETTWQIAMNLSRMLGWFLWTSEAASYYCIYLLIPFVAIPVFWPLIWLLLAYLCFCAARLWWTRVIMYTGTVATLGSIMAALSAFFVYVCWQILKFTTRKPVRGMVNEVHEKRSSARKSTFGMSKGEWTGALLASGGLLGLIVSLMGFLVLPFLGFKEAGKYASASNALVTSTKNVKEFALSIKSFLGGFFAPAAAKICQLYRLDRNGDISIITIEDNQRLPFNEDNEALCFWHETNGWMVAKSQERCINEYILCSKLILGDLVRETYLREKLMAAKAGKVQIYKVYWDASRQEWVKNMSGTAETTLLTPDLMPEEIGDYCPTFLKSLMETVDAAAETAKEDDDDASSIDQKQANKVKQFVAATVTPAQPKPTPASTFLDPAKIVEQEKIREIFNQPVDTAFVFQKNDVDESTKGKEKETETAKVRDEAEAGFMMYDCISGEDGKFTYFPTAVKILDSNCQGIYQQISEKKVLEFVTKWDERTPTWFRRNAEVLTKDYKMEQRREFLAHWKAYEILLGRVYRSIVWQGSTGNWTVDEGNMIGYYETEMTPYGRVKPKSWTTFDENPGVGYQPPEFKDEGGFSDALKTGMSRLREFGAVCRKNCCADYTIRGYKVSFLHWKIMLILGLLCVVAIGIAIYCHMRKQRKLQMKKWRNEALNDFTLEYEKNGEVVPIETLRGGLLKIDKADAVYKLGHGTTTSIFQGIQAKGGLAAGTYTAKLWKKNGSAREVYDVRIHLGEPIKNPRRIVDKMQDENAGVGSGKAKNLARRIAKKQSNKRTQLPRKRMEDNKTVLSDEIQAAIIDFVAELKQDESCETVDTVMQDPDCDSTCQTTTGIISRCLQMVSEVIVPEKQKETVEMLDEAWIAVDRLSKFEVQVRGDNEPLGCAERIEDVLTMPNHYLDQLDRNKVRVITMEVGNGANCSFSFPYNRNEWEKLPMWDTCAMPLPKQMGGVPAWKNVHTPPTGVFRGKVCIKDPKGLGASMDTCEFTVSENDGVPLAHYGTDHFPGACGSCLVTDENPPRIFGMHTQGDTRTRACQGAVFTPAAMQRIHELSEKSPLRMHINRMAGLLN